MLAQHPITGKPIRIMRSSSQLWRNAKTLVVLDGTADPAIPWDRWDTCCCGVANYNALRAKNIPVYIPILTNDVEITLAEFTKISEASKLIFLSMKLIKQLGIDNFRNGTFKNIVCLDEFTNIYAYCGNEWDGTDSDAVALAAMVLRYGQVCGAIGNTLSPERRQRMTEMSMSIISGPVQPPEVWLITQFFKSEKARRTREIRTCLEKNVDCAYIDKICLLNEADFSENFGTAATSPKLIQKVIGKRLTYDVVMKEIYETVPKQALVIFANSDIYFDDTLRFLWSLKMDDTFLSLLRWETNDNGAEPKLFGPRDDSQDAWILSANSVKQRTWKWETLEFPFGKSGCDNAISVEMLRQKFLVVNPAYSIKSYHIHSSQIRTYKSDDVIDKPIFLYIAPTGIHDMRIREQFNKDEILQIRSHRAIKRRFNSVQSEEVKTFCTMINRNKENEYKYALQDMNLAQPANDTILKLNDCFMTSSGLAFDHTSMYVGQTDASKQIWGKSALHACMPTMTTELALCVPITPKETATQEDFCLRYLAKVLQLRTMSGEFMCPRDKQYQDVLQLFRWNTQQVPVLEQKESLATYCKNAITWIASENENATYEDIQALRSAFQFTVEKPTHRKLVIVEDGVFIDKNWTTMFENMLESSTPATSSHISEDWDIHVIWPERTTVERIAYVLKDAEYLIFANNQKIQRAGWRWMWMMCPAAHVIEIQHEFHTCGNAIHLAGACELDAWLVIMKKGIPEYMRTESTKSVFQTIAKIGASLAVVPAAELPTIWVPRQDIQGFFMHAGDTFREMIQLWEERNYCKRIVHPTATQVWWGAVGSDGVLLYDRPTLDWLTAAPVLEKSWKKALFGNPAPVENTNSSVWSFWGRRPRLLEQLVTEGVHKHTFAERSKRMVFYGKIENSVQEKHRSIDWSPACDEFYMARGEKAKYRYTQEKYLRQLADSKYGLCLEGYGRKCNREIECMAMGCVPVVADGVDMNGYLHPPVEGVHYLRAGDGPDAASKRIAEIGEEKWSAMSAACHQWWLENASCEGLFRLTQSSV